MAWLADAPDDAEIGVAIGTLGQLALIAIVGSDVRLFAIGDVPYPAEKANTEASREAMIERLRQINAERGETDTGVMIVTLDGCISGMPHLFSKDFEDAFTFKDRAQAEAFIAEISRRSTGCADSQLLISTNDHREGTSSRSSEASPRANCKYRSLVSSSFCRSA
jgi:hypothetical protein